jgi:FkbM family methyltransferase
MKKTLTLAYFLLTIGLHAVGPSYKFEGVLGSPIEHINNMNANIQGFLPYNPVVIEIGAYTGGGTEGLSNGLPYGKIFAFEPNPKAYNELVERTVGRNNVFPINLAVNTFNGSARLYGKDAEFSLLRAPTKHKQAVLNVPCVILDDWCKANEIDHVDCLRLDAGGFESQILQSSPEIFNSVLVIVTKTYFTASNPSVVLYPKLKALLEKKGFELLSHWYQEGKQGEATFVRKYFYDSIFR